MFKKQYKTVNSINDLKLTVYNKNNKITLVCDTVAYKDNYLDIIRVVTVEISLNDIVRLDWLQTPLEYFDRTEYENEFLIIDELGNSYEVNQVIYEKIKNLMKEKEM